MRTYTAFMRICKVDPRHRSRPLVTVVNSLLEFSKQICAVRVACHFRDMSESRKKDGRGPHSMTYARQCCHTKPLRRNMSCWPDKLFANQNCWEQAINFLLVHNYTPREVSRWGKERRGRHGVGCARVDVGAAPCKNLRVWCSR